MQYLSLLHAVEAEAETWTQRVPRICDEATQGRKLTKASRDAHPGQDDPPPNGHAGDDALQRSKTGAGLLSS